MEQSENKLHPEFKSDYLDIDHLKIRLETEQDPEIKQKIQKQIELLEDALVIYHLHHNYGDTNGKK